MCSWPGTAANSARTDRGRCPASVQVWLCVQTLNVLKTVLSEAGGDEQLAAQLAAGVPVLSAVIKAKAALGPDPSKQTPEESWAACSAASGFLQVLAGLRQCLQ